MTMPTVELRCDTCAEPAFLYRLHGTADALCASCFVTVYVPQTSRARRRGGAGFAQRLGRSIAGCSSVAGPRR